MFYAFSKALLFLIQPATWLALLLIYALWCKRRRAKRRAIIASILLFFVLGNPALHNAVMTHIEWPVTSLAGEHYRYAIILGGHGEYNSNQQGLEVNRAADRILAAITLYHEGTVDQVILSSGVAPDNHPEQTEARISKDLLLKAGIPAEDILLEERSWNTHDNAVYTSELLQGLQGSDKALLVTSAFHMDRALQCFRKQGLSPTPYPVDFQSGGASYRGFSDLMPSIRVLIEWQVIIKEKVGLVVYGCGDGFE